MRVLEPAWVMDDDLVLVFEFDDVAGLSTGDEELVVDLALLDRDCAEADFEIVDRDVEEVACVEDDKSFEVWVEDLVWVERVDLGLDVAEVGFGDNEVEGELIAFDDDVGVIPDEEWEDVGCTEPVDEDVCVDEDFGGQGVFEDALELEVAVIMDVFGFVTIGETLTVIGVFIQELNTLSSYQCCT